MVTKRGGKPDREEPTLPGMASPRPRAVPVGHVERAFLATVRRARAAGTIDDTTDALVAVTRNVARGIDRITPGPRDTVKPYDLVPLAQLTREYRANVESLGLVPSGGVASDPEREFLDAVGTPTRVQDTVEP